MKKISLFFLFYFCVTAILYAQCPAAPIIKGLNVVCVGTQSTYSAELVGRASNFFWSIDGGGGLTPNYSQANVVWDTPGTFQISATPTFLPGCATPLGGTITVTVVNSPTIAAPTIISGPSGVCQGTATSTYTVPGITGQTPTWLLINPLITFTPPTLVTSGNQVVINWTNATTGQYILIASYNNGTCSGAQKSLPIIFSSGTGSLTMNGKNSYCTSQTGSFNVFGDPQDTFTWSILPAGGSVLTSSGGSATVQWNSPGTYTLTASATNPCNSTPRTVSKTVTVVPLITNPGVISKMNPITCVNQTERFSITAITGATYTWTVNTTLGVLYYTTSVPYLDRSFPTATSGTITVTASNGSCDSQSSPAYSFSVGLSPMQLSFSPSVCVGSPTTVSITSTSDISMLSFTWSVGDGTIIGPSNGSSITVKWNTTGSKVVSATTSTPCGTMGATSALNPITVQEASFLLYPISGVSRACLGEYTYVSQGSQGGITTTWNVTQQGGGTTNGGIIRTSSEYGVNIKTYAAKIIWNTPGNYTINISSTNSCGTLQSQSLNVNVASETKPLTAQINGVSSDPICVSSFPTTKTYSVPSTNGYTYAWEVTPSTAGVLSTSNNIANVIWNQLGNSNTLAITPSTASCTGEKTYLYTPTNMNSAVGVLSSSVTSPVCGLSDIPVTLSLTSSTGSITYQVRTKTDNGSWSGWTNFYSPTYTITQTVSAQAYHYEFQAIVQSATCSPVTSNIVPITVYQLPYFTNNTVFVQERCSGIVTIAPTSIITTATFSWTSSVSGSITGATASGTGTILNTLTNTGSVIGRVDYYVTPRANGCNGPTRTFTTYVHPTPVLGINPPKSICSGQSASYDIVASPSGIEYSWPDPDGAGPAVNALYKRDYLNNSEISDVLINTSSSSQTVTYQVTPYYRNGNVTCVGTSGNIAITIVPKPSVTNSLTALGCSGVPLNIPLTSNIPSSFQWRAADNFSTTGESTTLQTGSIINNTITNNTSTAQTIVYTVTPTSTAASCSGTSSNITVNLSAISPTITNSPLTNTICSGGTLNFIPTSNIAGATYTWTSSVSGTVTGAATNGSGAITHTLTNTGITNGTVTYTITPWLGNCNGTPSSYIVTIKPLPVTTAVNQTICSGLTNVALSANISGTTFSWPVPTQVGAAGGAAGSGSTISQALTNASNTIPGTVTYLVTPSANGCIGTPKNVIITVNKKPVVSITGSSNFCVGSNAKLYADVQGNNCTFAWSNGTTNAYNFITAAGTYSVTVISVYNGCTTTSSSFTVNPPIQNENGGSITASPNPCINGVGNPLTLTTPTISGATYQWSTGANTASINITTAANYTVIITPPSGGQKKGCYDAYFCAVRMAQPEFGYSRDIDVLQEEVEYTSLAYYPNPANESLSVKLPQKAKQSTLLRIFDVNGRNIFTTSFDQGDQIKVINTIDFIGGLYLIQIETDKEVFRSKVLITHINK